MPIQRMLLLNGYMSLLRVRDVRGARAPQSVLSRGFVAICARVPFEASRPRECFISENLSVPEVHAKREALPLFR